MQGGPDATTPVEEYDAQRGKSQGTRDQENGSGLPLFPFPLFLCPGYEIPRLADRFASYSKGFG
jgi:hypothetical protein